MINNTILYTATYVVFELSTISSMPWQSAMPGNTARSANITGHLGSRVIL